MKQKGICEECRTEYEYEYNPKYPRKYCPTCSAVKKKAYEDMQNAETFPVVKMANRSEIHSVPSAEPIRGMTPAPKAYYPKDPVGLAVDIFVALYDDRKAATDVMQVAIDVVKQAQEAFS